ncbi:PhzF family phenazine biosynthesis isomerase [uncultured Shewanella sp.]|uniref:PhzF family phenazine biosynthesis protein n=1 Tax=uncultured Shewanella sp. TaxID=173975 RepID=UPI0026226C7F|nr:PhzF family phenazine biosynthesis isomerase [uncultured Shewanella sp.]
MQVNIYQVDAFTTKVFKGNPAAVCPLNAWLSDGLLQQIAEENNLSETAFFVPTEKGFHLRWFTPVEEVDLCGHGALANAFVIFNHLQYAKSEISFTTFSGELIVKKRSWSANGFSKYRA